MGAQFFVLHDGCSFFVPEYVLVEGAEVRSQ